MSKQHHPLQQFDFWSDQAVANLGAEGWWISTAEQVFDIGKHEGGLRFLSQATGLSQKRVVELIALTRTAIETGNVDSFRPADLSPKLNIQDGKPPRDSQP